MTCELITGSAGTEHISSADDGSMYASVFGPGRYAVNQGSNFAATLASANIVQIGTGAGFMDGRYFRVTAAENVSIDSGTQGNNRIDLIGVKYVYTTGTGIETCSLAVVKGTPTSGTPSEPTYTDGDILAGATEAFFPLYSVTITGVTPANPVQLFTFMQGTTSCPWPVGAVLQLTNGTNPNDVYPGTYWEKIEGMFLLGSSSGYTRGSTGGAATVTLTSANLPSHTHTYDKANATSGGTSITVANLPQNYASFSVRRVNDGAMAGAADGSNVTITAKGGTTSLNTVPYQSATSMKGDKLTFTGSGTAHTHSVSTTSNISGSTGSGTAVNKMPPYRVVDMWERTA